MEEIKDDDNVKEMNDTNVTFKNHDHVNVENKMLLMTMMKMMERTISKINLSEQKFPSFLSFSVYTVWDEDFSSVWSVVGQLCQD